MEISAFLKGQVSIYAARGDYQLIVKTIEPAGSGNLMQKFERLKKNLMKRVYLIKIKRLNTILP
jgi:exodeoxyribonuclease VII large subunit